MTQRMVYAGSLDGSQPIYKEVPVNTSQTIMKGSIVVKATGKASVAAAAAAAGTVWGVAAMDYTSGGSVTAADLVKIDVNPNSVYEMPHNTAGTKTSLTAEDIGKVFDLGSNSYTVNLDDTTGGYIELVGLVDNKPNRGKVLLKNRVQTV